MAQITVDYCQPSDVGRVFGSMQGGLRMSFSSETNPSESDILKFIEEAETEIDKDIHTSFKPVTVTDEYKDFYGNMVKKTKYFSSYFPIHMDKPILSLTKLEIYDGNRWVDFVAEKTLGAAFLNEDYWFAVGKSTIYLHIGFPQIGRKVIRVTYQTGLAAASVPKDIRQATAMQVCINLVLQYGADYFRTEGGGGLTAEQQIREWEKRIDKITKEYDREQFFAFVA